MKKNRSPKKHRLHPVSLYPLKAEEALSLFMQVDPTPVRAGMRNLPRKTRKPSALPTG
jgi:hypothetical protein